MATSLAKILDDLEFDSQKDTMLSVRFAAANLDLIRKAARQRRWSQGRWVRRQLLTAALRELKAAGVSIGG